MYKTKVKTTIIGTEEEADEADFKKKNPDRQSRRREVQLPSSFLRATFWRTLWQHTLRRLQRLSLPEASSVGPRIDPRQPAEAPSDGPDLKGLLDLLNYHTTSVLIF